MWGEGVLGIQPQEMPIDHAGFFRASDGLVTVGNAEQGG